jgi:hypothetical protein
MSAAIHAVRPRLAALAAANLAAAALAIWPWLQESAGPVRATAASSLQDAPAIAALPPLAEFSATTERPLFAPSRRPSPGAAPPGASAIESRYRLQGLVIAGNSRRALVAEIASGRRFEVGEGEAIEGWIVRRIERNAITLASPSGEATLTLRGTGGAAPSPRP